MNVSSVFSARSYPALCDCPTHHKRTAPQGCLPVEDPRYITLQVLLEVIRRAIVLDSADHVPVVVIPQLLRTAALCARFIIERFAFRIVLMRRTVYRFLCTDSVRVVLVGDAAARTQHSAAPPFQHIPHVIAGIAVIVVAADRFTVGDLIAAVPTRYPDQSVAPHILSKKFSLSIF